MILRRVLLGGVAGALALVAPIPIHAAPKARELGAALAPLKLVGAAGRPLTITGLHRYSGRLEISSAADGLVISNRLPLERYLLGLAEVPLSWPFEALKAQAVAARTYALFTLAQPPGGSAATYGFDICASVECQVYSGADVAQAPGGLRWREAVGSTAGQAVLYQGAPILARYHSTSGGQTLDNPQAFPDEGAYPYLRSVPSPTEQGSPLYRWTVDIPLVRMQAMLRNAGLWTSDHGRLLEVHSVPSSAGFHYPDLVLRGKRGRVVVTAEEIRELVRDLAPQMFPGDYPSFAPTGTGRLPETFPSNRIDVFTKRKTMRVIGRGWGHGVGMSQWGAHGLALRGASYLDILTHYYTGVEVAEVADPGPIEVGLDTAERSVRVAGEFSIVDGRGKTLVPRALGEWGFAWAGAGAVTIDPPLGFGLPLQVGLVGAPRRVELGGSVYLTVALSRPAKVRTITKARTGYDDPGVKVAGAGRRRIVWPAPLEEGTFEVQVEARAGGVRSRTEPVEIVVFSKDLDQGSATGSPGEVGDEEGDGPARFPLLLVASVAVAAVLGGTLVWGSGRRRIKE